jgi:hypothetical protein
MNINLPANMFAKATAGTASACGPKKPGLPAALRDSRSCAVQRAGGGCGAGQVCVPKPGNAFAMCVTKPGAIVCPGAFPSAHRAGTSASDTRTCGTCSCTAAPCTGELHLFDDKDCSGAEKLKINATAPPGACGHLTNAAFQMRGYTTTVTGGCVPSGPAPMSTGALTLEGESTICCK